MPLLSLMMIARDDDYLPGYMDRLKLTIDSFIKVFERFGLEIILLDFNQVPGRPLSKIFNHKCIKHVIFTYGQYIDKLNISFKNGVIIYDNYNNPMSAEDVADKCPVISTLGTNLFIKYCTASYFIYSAPDVIATNKLVLELINNLSLDRCVFASSKCTPLEFALNNFDNIVSGDIFSATDISFPRSVVTTLVGNGLFCVLPMKLAKDIGGYLPFISHRGKGADFFLSFILSSYKKKYFIPNYFPIEITHNKKRQSKEGFNFTVAKDNKVIFDFTNDYKKVSQWVTSNNISVSEFHRILPTFPMEYILENSNKEDADRMMSCFKNLYGE